ncbi:MAG TPA: glycosyltransferase family 1 protein [Vineibacter sp.]|nr:glycosyltransferase family 1 protein [Vineibacter sp.]
MVRFVDVSRLVENLHLDTPTGIDRYEMAYVRHMLRNAGPDDVRFVVTWPHFAGLLDAADARRIFDALDSRWSPTVQPADQAAAFVALREALRRPPLASHRRGALRIGRDDNGADAAATMRRAIILARSAVSPMSRRRLAAWRQTGIRYFHTSQFRLHRPRLFTWLADPAISSLFVLHDLIPIIHPEYCRPGESERHARRLETMARHASVIIANSHATASTLKTWLDGKNRPMPPCEVVPPGIADAFLAAGATAPLEAATPYFVAIGTIEPRKNLAFLLQVWNRWMRGGAPRRARLVIVGRRGWENENVVDLLERSAGLASTVIEVATLGDAAMVALLKGANALLAPSLVEGYGLPVAEALALGVPVIASGIDAHREVGGAFVDYVGPTDGLGWISALEAYADPTASRRVRRLADLRGYKPHAWGDHMAQVEAILARHNDTTLDSVAG